MSGLADELNKDLEEKGLSDKSTGDDDKGKPSGDKNPPAIDYSKLSAPEGFDYGDDDRTAFGGMKLSEEQATAVLKWGHGRSSAATGAAGDTQNEAREERLKGYDETLRQNPAFAGDKYQEAFDTALAGFKAAAPPELLESFTEKDLDHHPGLILHFHQIGKMIQEDDTRDWGSIIGSSEPETLQDRIQGELEEKGLA